jgi:hypothetical protein
VSPDAACVRYVLDEMIGVPRSLPAGHDAAVDGQYYAGDEARLVRREEQQRFRRIRYLAVAAERMDALKVGSAALTCSGVKNVS